MEQKINYYNATMKDVANAAGVSTATVSRALTKPDQVSVKTRQKVEQAASKTGYDAYYLTKNIKSSKPKTIFVAIPDITNPICPDIISGIEQVAAEQGYMVLIGGCKHYQKQQYTLIDIFISQRIDGIVLLNSDIPFSLTNRKPKDFPPIVVANEFVPEFKLATINIDNLTYSFNAINFLQKLGHKYIACITGPETFLSCQYRLQGYMQAIQRAGNKVQQEYIINSDFSYQGGAEGIKKLFTLPKPPSAIFCHNDIMAIGAIWQAKRMGLTLPRDLSIIGFGNLNFAQYSEPALTTIEQPRFEIGRQAMLLLLAKIQGHEIDKNAKLLDCHLIIRDSVCPPKD